MPDAFRPDSAVLICRFYLQNPIDVFTDRTRGAIVNSILPSLDILDDFLKHSVMAASRIYNLLKFEAI